MPNNKYEEFKQQIYREFEQGKRPKELAEAYKLKDKPSREQVLPTRNAIYAWYRGYLSQNKQNVQQKQDSQALQKVNSESDDENESSHSLIGLGLIGGIALIILYLLGKQR